MMPFQSLICTSRAAHATPRLPGRHRLRRGVRAGVFCALGFVFAFTGPGCRRADPGPLPEPDFPERALLWLKTDHGLLFQPPTDQDRLLETESTEVYMPTASGRVESALFGSVRTRNFGNTLRAAFHEGIDIAPMRRDARGRPLDEIYAAADGRVAFINPTGGASSYGIYVVLAHDDLLGEYYTLYAHMASVPRSLRVGQRVKAGHVLGVMGNTANTGIPMVRAHLHFEILLMMNRRFDRWFAAQQLTGIRDIHHGWNMHGINPLTPWLRAQERSGKPYLCMASYVPGIPPAFELVVRTQRPLDYFRRYPLLWQGPVASGGGPVVLNVSESGLPIQGRAATPEEIELLGSDDTHVLTVDPDVLGRNGRYLIRRSGSQWQITDEGRRWLSILRY